MWETDHRPLLFAIILGMMAVVAVAVAAHFLIRRAVRDLIARSAAKQLQMDLHSFKTGAALRQIGSSPTASNRTLFKAIVGRV